MGSHRRPIRRSIVIRASVVLLLIVGAAIVNVTVAWGSALFPTAATKTELSSEAAEAELQTAFERVLHFLEPLPATGTVYKGARWERRHAMAMIDVNGVITFVLKEQVSSGWPLASLSGKALQWGRQPKQSFGLIETTSRVWGQQVHVMLPTRVIWPGFAINTLFYAAILWAVFAVPAALRRKRRIKRGVCPKCAYPIGESAVCTECGSSIPSP